MRIDAGGYVQILNYDDLILKSYLESDISENLLIVVTKYNHQLLFFIYFLAQMNPDQ